MLRSLLIFFSLGIIVFSSWSAFVKPTYQKTAVNDLYPGTLSSQVIAEQPLFGQKDSITGNIKLIIEENNTTYIRLEDFLQRKQIPACPELKAYLTVDLDPKNKLDLGKLVATEGNINFTLPEKTDYKEYTHFVLWCTTYNSDYAHADIIEKENKGLFIK
jgi:hypothetical protein